jgi:hypothetical protein
MNDIKMTKSQQAHSNKRQREVFGFDEGDIQSDIRKERLFRIAQFVGWTILVFIVGYVTLWASARYDVRRAEAMAKYTACFEERYHTTPAAWYAEKGSLPECQ